MVWIWFLNLLFHALNWYIFTALTTKKLLLSSECMLNRNRVPDSLKLLGYLASAFIVVLSKPCVSPSPRAKLFLSLPLICTEDYYQLQR